MKKTIALLLTGLILFSLAACASPEVHSPASETPAPEEIAPRPITSKQYFRHIAEGERVSCENSQYGNTTNDGCFVIPNSYVDGTPYSFHGIVFDPAMVTGASVTIRDDGSSAPGSGATSYEWQFTPLMPGETEIMLITDNLADDTQECRVFHITVQESNNKLRCALNWYEDGIMGEHYELCPLEKTPPADEYDRAVWYGFLPEDLAELDPDGTTVTWAQYCDMLGRMIKLHKESESFAWEDMTKAAPNTGMKRDGAMVSLLFAAKTMGFATFNAEPPAAFFEYADQVWNNVTKDYPVFDWDTPIDLGDGCTDNNHVGPAYDFCLRRLSVVSGKSLLEFSEHNDLRLSEPLTLREAMLSAVRLYESEYGEFVSGVSDEALQLAKKMPAATYDNLPRWCGYTVPPRMWWYSPETQETYTDEELALYALFGFNFLRAPLLSEELFNDFDVSQPNRAAFQRLDALLEHAAKYGIHICMDLHMMPGFTTNETDDDDILFQDEATQELFADIWRTIAVYFRDVPSNLLSFNLLNEPHPHTDEVLTDEIYSAVMQKAIDAIRESSPERLIIASGVGVSWAEPCEGLANAKIAQGTSVYFLNEGADMWPLYYINKNMNADDGDLTLKGDFPAGSTLTVSVMQYSGGSYSFFADQTRIAEFSIAGDTFDASGITIQNGAALKEWVGWGGAYGWYTLQIPIDAPCTSLRLSKKNGGYYEMQSIHVKTPDTSYAIMANDNFVSSQTPPVLTLNNDNTVTAKQSDTLFAMNEDGLYGLMEKYARFTERTGQECMLLEFGFNSTIPYNVAIQAADAFFNAAERSGLSWCSWYDDYGPMINYEAALAYAQGSGGDDYRRTDAAYTACNSRFSYLPELMEVYQRHMQ